MSSSKAKVIILPMIAMFFFIGRGFLHFFFLSYNFEKLAGYLSFPGDSDVAFDIILGTFLAVVAHYGFKSDYSDDRTLSHLLQVILVLAILTLGLCVFPYNGVNEILKEEILEPVFVWIRKNGFLNGVKSADIEILKGNFYLHFIWREAIFIEWIVTYLVFQGCTQIAFRKRIKSN